MAVKLGLKNEDEIKKIAIDLGSSSIKICGEVNGKPIFKRIISKATTEATDDKYVVKTTGSAVHFGVGNPLVRQDKTDRLYIAEQILLAVHQIYGATDEPIKIKLATGLPLNLFMAEPKRQEFQDKLEVIASRCLTGIVNNELVSIEIVDFTICAEGYSAYLALMGKIRTRNPFMIFDFGYRTTDVLAVTPSEDGLVIEKFKTIDKGMYEVYTEIQREILSELKKNLPLERIESAFLNNPKISIPNKKEIVTIDINEWAKYGHRALKPILSELEMIFPDMFTREFFLVGGGASIIESIANSMANEEDENERLILMTELASAQDDLTFANCVGYFMQIED